MSRPRTERPTLAEVADAAGVSRATVSKVLNGRHDVSPETRSRVEHLLDEHAYVRRSAPRGADAPDATARGGLDLVVDSLENPYTLEVIRGVSQAAEEEGLELVLTMSSADGAAAWVERITAAGRQGAIVVTSSVSSPQRRALAVARVPLVLIDPLVVTDDVPSVGVTNWAGGLAATEHLIELGHRRIAVLSGVPHASSAIARVHGFRAALANAGLTADPDLIRPGDFGAALARESALELLRRRRPPTAIFATSDAQALGALAAARESGLAVPRDLSVVGFDGLSLMAWSSPPLTTIQTPMADMGRMAVRTLAYLAGGGELESARIELSTRLVVRESTAPPREDAGA